LALLEGHKIHKDYSRNVEITFLVEENDKEEENDN
jgi:hypothetical protein